MQSEFSDILIIGAGGAGLRAAVAAGAGGLSVRCVSKVPVTRSHTVAAQGGINAALGNRAADRWEWHAHDTLKGGAYLSDVDAVEFMCARAAEAIVELEHMGMPFTRDGEGQIYQRAYGGQYTDFGKGAPAYRACAVADRTGHSMLHTLYSQALKAGVMFEVECLCLDLLFSPEGACVGVLAWRLEAGELVIFRAHRVILATGGYGQAWASTTASSICTGDGGGMVVRAGFPLQDMEFVQFHPTSLHGTGILITEGARGEGASLLNGNGERFMEHYAPNSMELSARDVIARAMTQEILEGRGCGPNKDHLHLDLRHLNPEMVQAQLPSVLEIARTFGRMDALTAPIPVLPAVHYTMGGIASNARSEVLDVSLNPVPGLMVVGEAACNSVHGANRLGCNSLLDLVVFGKAAGEACAREVKAGAAHASLHAASLDAARTKLEGFLDSRGAAPPSRLRKQMQAVMQHHAGIFRTPELMQTGLEKLRAIRMEFEENLRITDRSLLWNNELAEAYECENLLLQAIATLASAVHRTESRGAHFRADFPHAEEAWKTHSLVLVEPKREAMHTRPVRVHPTMQEAS